MVKKFNKQRRQPRYLEISQRNMVSRIFIGKGSGCSGKGISCNDICIDIIRAGAYKCTHAHGLNSCACHSQPIPICDPVAATVCAKEIDDDGWAVFEWPNSLLSLKEGWYEGKINSSCSTCGEIPVRVGPRCNVIEVETIVSGPDSACFVGCDEDCGVDPCLDGKPGTVNQTTYNPGYEGL